MTFSECSEAKKKEEFDYYENSPAQGLGGRELIQVGKSILTIGTLYVHGTNHEERLGKPASSGCLQMGNEDIAELFDLLPEGTHLRKLSLIVLLNYLREVVGMASPYPVRWKSNFVVLPVFCFSHV